jgi:hypothetical protein
MDYLSFENNLANYLLGMPCDIYKLKSDLKIFKQCIYTGYIFRGLAFKNPIDKSEIKNSELCSWSKDLSVAENFATHDKYHYIIIKKSRGICIQSLLNYLKDNNLMVSETLLHYTTKYEQEVIDDMHLIECSVMEKI